MKFGIKEDQIRKMQAVFAAYPQVQKVILYGSRAKGNYKTGSDIDLCLVGQDLDQTFLYRIEELLDELLLPYTFDLSIYGNLSNQDLIDHIDRVGVVLYQKKI